MPVLLVGLKPVAAGYAHKRASDQLMEGESERANVELCSEHWVQGEVLSGVGERHGSTQAAGKQCNVQ